ncbi:globin-like [Amphibalanus amphitrite]|uniref:globin-like n=1 Tax=Amphibalanus amphitrite TaxID=1232801 RepID=UPI001C923A47|nr:globin-like [Amphibalanus amphitrite]
MGASQTRSSRLYHGSTKSICTSSSRGGSAAEQRSPEPPPPLTGDDKRLLQRTWKALEADPTTVGVIMFTRLFEAHPEMQGNFKSFRDLDLEDLKMSQELRQHSSRVMGFVNKLISRLGTDEQLDTLTLQLCQRHLDYGALPQHMTIIGDQFVSVLRSTLENEGSWDDETEKAWQKLFRILAFTYEAMHSEWSRSASRRSASQRHPCLERVNGLGSPSSAPGTCCAHVIEY